MSGAAVTEAFISYSGREVSIDEYVKKKRVPLVRCLSCGDIVFPDLLDSSDPDSRVFMHGGFKGARCPSFYIRDPKYYFLKHHLFDARMQDGIKKSLQRVNALNTKATVRFHERFTWGHKPQKELWQKIQEMHLDKLVVLKDHPWLLPAFLMMSLGKVSLSIGNYAGDYVLKGAGTQTLSFKGYDHRPYQTKIPERLDVILVKGRRVIRVARTGDGQPISFPLNKDACYELAGMGEKSRHSICKAPYTKAMQLALFPV